MDLKMKNDFTISDSENSKIYEVKEKNMYNYLKNEGFYFSDKPDGVGSAYIMSDGKFLFLEKNKNILRSEIITHGTLDLYLIDKGYISETTKASRILCQTDNAIRINDGKNFVVETLVGLPKYKVSIQQLKSLKDWLENMLERGKYNISIGNELLTVVFDSYDLRENQPQKIVQQINKFYHENILICFYENKQKDID